MKNIVGKEARVYNYINNVFKTVSSYYGYEDIKLPTLVNGNLRKDLENEVIDYYNKNIKGEFKKYAYVGTNYEKNKENEVFGFAIIKNNSLYQDAEVISMVYRILEELKLENIIVKIKADKNYDLNKLQEYLEYLDVDYEISDSGDLLDDNVLMAFEIIEEVQDKKISLARGYRNSDNVDAIFCTTNLDNVLEVLNIIYEDYEFDTLTQVYIVGESEEERIVAMRLAQDLRWCEIKVDMDTNNKKRNEQLNSGKTSNFIIDISKDNLNKGLIKVIDNRTHEENLVDEAEIIDYIVSNI